MNFDAIRAALDQLSGYSEVENGVRLNSHCMYPNNGFVRVLVMGAGDSFTVSDEGGAFREAVLAGAEVDYTDRKFAKAVSAQGLNMRHGVIMSPSVTFEALPMAIALVANASKETADWMFEHWRLTRERKFKDILKTILKVEFNAVKQQTFTGDSNKPHTFDTVVQFMNGSRLLVDAVSKDPNSINARVLANLDVKNANHDNLEQRIVYDDEEDWGAADLSLLRVSGVPIVPFSKSVPVLKALAPH